MTGTRPQSRHNECTTPGVADAKSGARFVPACDYQDRFTEPPHRATEAKQQGQGRGSPILVPGNVTERPTPGHPRQRPPHPAPVAQWIEQAPSKRLAAGSSPAGGASLRPPLWEGFSTGQRGCPAVRLSPGVRLRRSARQRFAPRYVCCPGVLVGGRRPRVRAAGPPFQSSE